MALVAAAIGAPVGPTAPGEVAADCGATGNFYAWGRLNPTPTAIGVRGNIQWTDGALCNSGVSHSVTLCRTDTCGKYVQTGWRNYSSYAEPRGYCEWGGQQYRMYEFEISHAPHEFKAVYDTRDDYWDCYLDGTAKTSYTLANAGFSDGVYTNAQGEAHRDHAQIGRMAPGKLAFQELDYKKESDNSWNTMNLALGSTPWPYDREEPAAGKMRVWTNDH